MKKFVYLVKIVKKTFFAPIVFFFNLQSRDNSLRNFRFESINVCYKGKILCTSITIATFCPSVLDSILGEVNFRKFTQCDTLNWRIEGWGECLRHYPSPEVVAGNLSNSITLNLKPTPFLFHTKFIQMFQFKRQLK